MRTRWDVWRDRIVLVVIAGTLATGYVLAQAPKEPPALSEIDQLKLQNFELATDNLKLRVQQALTSLAAVERESAALLKNLAKPGYRLERGTDGRWVYQPESTP